MTTLFFGVGDIGGGGVDESPLNGDLLRAGSFRMLATKPDD